MQFYPPISNHVTMEMYETTLSCLHLFVHSVQMYTYLYDFIF